METPYLGSEDSTYGVPFSGRPDFLMAGCHTLWRQFESRTRVPVGVEKIGASWSEATFAAM